MLRRNSDEWFRTIQRRICEGDFSAIFEAAVALRRMKDASWSKAVSDLAFEFGELGDLTEEIEGLETTPRRERMLERQQDFVGLRFRLYDTARMLGVDPGDDPEMREASADSTVGEEASANAEWLHKVAGDLQCPHDSLAGADACDRCKGTFWFRPLD